MSWLKALKSLLIGAQTPDAADSVNKDWKQQLREERVRKQSTRRTTVRQAQSLRTQVDAIVHPLLEEANADILDSEGEIDREETDCVESGAEHLDSACAVWRLRWLENQDEDEEKVLEVWVHGPKDSVPYAEMGWGADMVDEFSQLFPITEATVESMIRKALAELIEGN